MDNKSGKLVKFEGTVGGTNINDFFVFEDDFVGLATAADLAGQGFTAVGEVAEAGQRAANLGFLLVLIPTAAAAYWYFLGRR